MEAAQDYEYRITTVWQNGTERTTAESAPRQALACPVNLALASQCLSVDPGGPSNNLSWNSLEGVQEYEVYRQLPGESDYSRIADNVTGTSYADNLVESYSSGYYNTGSISYFVRAVWTGAQSDSSDNPSSDTSIAIRQCEPFLEVAPVCADPEDETSEDGFQLSWTATQDAQHYNISRNGQFLEQVSNSTLFLFDQSPSEATWSYQVEAVTGSGNLDSNEVTETIDCTVDEPPDPPVLQEASPFCSSGDSRVHLEWSAVPNVTSYTVYRHTQGGNTSTFPLSASTVSWDDTGVESGFTYDYWVTATGPGGESAASNVLTREAVSCIPPTTPEITETNTQCVSGSPEVSISWSSDDGNTLRYVMERSADGGSTFPFTVGTFEQEDDEFDSKTAMDLNATAGETYHYRVVAEGPTGVAPAESDSSQVSVPSCAPATPSLAASNECVAGSAQVNLSWSVSDTANIDHFEVFRDNVQLPHPFLGSSATSYEDDTASAAVSYTYRVDAVGPTGQTASSADVPITTNDCSPPGAFSITEPINLQCNGPFLEARSSGNSGIAWSSSSNADSYDLFREKASDSSVVTHSDVSSPYLDEGFGDAVSATPEQYSWQAEAQGPGGTRLSPQTAQYEAPICVPEQPTITELAPFCDAGNTTFPVSIDVNWIETINSTEYEIYRNTTGVGPLSAELVDTVSRTAACSGGDCSFTDNDGGTGLQEEVTYYYWVRAIGPTGLEATSARDDITTPLCIPPTQPSNLAVAFECTGAGGTSPPQAVVSWGDSANADHYTVYRDGASIGTVSDNNSATYTFADTPGNGFEVGTQYLYSVAAFGPGGKSPDPDPEILLDPADHTDGNYCKPPAPAITSLTTECNGDPENTLSWTEESTPNNTASYEIYRNTTNTPPASPVVSGITGASWTDNTLNAPDDSDTTFYYWVRAVGAGPTQLESDDSASATVHTPACGIEPEVPANLSIDNAYCEAGFPKLDISWDASVFAQSYRVTREDSFGNSVSFRTSDTSVTDRYEFEEEWTAPNGDSWSADWSFEVVAGHIHEISVQDNRGRIAGLQAGPFHTDTILALHEGVSFGDVDMTFGYANIDQTENVWERNSPGLVARFQESNPDTFYFMRYRPDDPNELSIRKSVNGVVTVIAEQSMSLSPPYALRFRVEQQSLGTTLLQAKAWESGSGEPGAWTLEVGDNEQSLQNVGGKAGLYAHMLRRNYVEFDDLAITYPVPPLETEETYTYTVTAVGVDTESDASDAVSETTPDCAPGEPNLAVAPHCEAGNPTLKLDWDPLDPNTEYVEIYKTREGDCIPEDTKFTFNAPQVSYIDSNVESPGVTYEYCAVGFGGGESGSFSPAVSATTETCANLPYGGDETEMQLIISAQCSGSVPKMFLDWDEDDTGNTTSYDIFRQDVTAGGSFEFVVNRSATQTSYSDTSSSLVPGNEYIYRIEAIGPGGSTTAETPATQAKDDCDTSPPEPAGLCDGSAELPSPCLIVVSKGHQQAVSVSWTDSSNEYDTPEGDPNFPAEAGYRLFRDTDSTPNQLIEPLPGGDELSYSTVDNSVTDNTAYSYQIRSYNDNTDPYGGPGDLGGVFSNVLEDVLVPIAIPGDFELSGSPAGGGIELTWEQADTTDAGRLVHDGESYDVRYEVFRGSTEDFDIASEGTFVCAVEDVDYADPANSPLSCTDADPDSAEPWYRVRATNRGGSTESNTERFFLAFLPELWREISPF